MEFESAFTEAGVRPPVRLMALQLYLAGGSLEILDPSVRRGVHPLVVPLARDERGDVLGLLRWPTAPEGMPLPVVRQEQHGLVLVATSTDELLHRELATRDATAGEEPGALLQAANAPDTLYRVGDVARTGLPLNAYLLLKVGVTHAFFEELVELHLEKGDQKAALVTADRSCRVAAGWARPHAFRAFLLERVGQLQEARDAARLALLEPVWTLGMPFAPVARLAGWSEPIGSAPYRVLAEDPSKPVLDRAAHRMDAAQVEGGDWDAVRPELAALYAEAGLEDLARWVAG